jgi:uncharacterized protein YprB with RNaseH-like and TPR domain
MNLKDRIAALQRQRAAPSIVAEPAGDTRDMLRRLVARRQPNARAPLRAPVGVETAAGVHLVEGSWSLPAAEPMTLLPWGEPRCVARERLVCFDTETTGLSGGVGTKAFMIGWGCWRGERFVTRQLYLTALGGEDAMLKQFAAALPDDPVFVSYNGRSYDTPLLKGRYRINRQPHPFADREHVDLLHPVRRRFRGRWENCRLQTVERQLLDIVRDDDLPGSEAPGAWLAFLRGQSSRGLARVVDHNRQDIVTLARLLVHLSATVADDAAPRPVCGFVAA